LRKYK